MTQARKYRGFSTERVVARYLSEWWPHADIGRGAGKDITHIPLIDIEVKARSTFQPKAWIDQVTKRAGKVGDLPIVVSRLNGQGEMQPENYLAFLRLGDLVDLLIKAGYADITEERDKLEPMRCTMCGAWTFAVSICVKCAKVV